MSDITPGTPTTQDNSTQSPTTQSPTTPTATRAPMTRRNKVLIGAGAAALLVLGGTGIAFAATDGFDMDDDDRTTVSQDDTHTDDDRTTGADDVTSTDPEDAAISDADRTKAESAGLKAAGGDGTVTDLERSDDLDHAWEVEVTFADGRDVDVELAEDFTVTRVDKK